MAKGNCMSFQELKDSVVETYDSMAMLIEQFDWGFFSADGQNKIEAYAILDDCFRIAHDIESLIDAVAGEINNLEKEIQTATAEDAADKREVIKLLANYIVDNVKDELTAGRREFNLNHRTRGC